jgi:hypothetical protein
MKRKVSLFFLASLFIQSGLCQLSSLEINEFQNHQVNGCPVSRESDEKNGWPAIFEDKLGSRFFIYAVRSNFYGFPMSYDENWEGICRSDSKGFGIGGGYTVVFDDYPVSWDIGFHYATAEFTDYRITNRRISYYIIDFLDLGYMPVQGKIPVCININVGVGLFHQSDYEETISLGTSDPHEYLDEWDWPMRMGVDVKIGLIRYCMLKCSYHYYVMGGGPDGGAGTIIINSEYDPEIDKLGHVLSFGLELYLDPFN